MSALPEFVSAVDLGSNSFHLVIGRLVNGQLRVVDRMKEMVQLAAGLDENDEIDAAARTRALECLQRFGQRLRDFSSDSVRAVGTNTFRKAHNAESFLGEAQLALGHRIEIIAGREEARLIYLGVAHHSVDVLEQRLVVDIGGGSTEFIIGRRFTPLLTESLYMGCVSMTRACFDDGVLSEERMQRAELLAAQEIEAIEIPYRRVGWGHAIGSSGSILAVRSVIESLGLDDRGITAAALRELRARTIAAGHVSRLGFAAIQGRRQTVFAGGLAILKAVFDAFDLDVMDCSEGALREGLLYDLQGRITHADMREETIDQLISTYHIDVEQANRVERTALHLRAQVDGEWRLCNDFYGNLLAWSARLHELGASIAHNQYHKHGAYVLRHADLPGFSRQEQQLLGTLVRLHRRKFTNEPLAQLDARLRERIRHLAILLRLAVVLHRNRDDVEVPLATAEEAALSVTFESGWLDAHPLTRADLAQEAQYLSSAGYELRFE